MPQSNVCTICLFLLLNVVSFRFSGVVSEPQVPCLFIFGDSLVDNGNNNYIQTTAKANYFPYGIDYPAGPTGRFTNGRNVVDFVAEMLGFEKSIPPFTNATDQDLLGGVNYGSGAAGILDESGSHFGDVISFNEQLANHEVAIPRLAALLGSKSAAEQHLNSCLYYVAMGSNDYLGNYLPLYYSSTTNYTPKQFSDLAIKKYSEQLQRLYNKGARKVAVLALGKLGCIPQQRAMYPTSELSGCVETSNDVSEIFNENLVLLINDLNNRLPGANFVYATDISDNISYGNITNVGDPCCPVSDERLGHCVVGGIPCSKRDEYYFWDAIHPTEAANSASATIVYDAISPLVTHLVDVW